MRIIPLMTIAMLTLAGCGSSHAATGKPSGTLSPTPTPTPTGPAALGTTQHRTAGDISLAVTALHFRAVRSHADMVEPSHRFLGADVRVCITRETKGAVSLSPEPWSIDYADDTEAQPIGEWWDGEFDQPLYPAERKVTAGRCVRGWIMFKPLPGRPVRVTYSPDDTDPASWRIP